MDELAGDPATTDAASSVGSLFSRSLYAVVHSFMAMVRLHFAEHHGKPRTQPTGAFLAVGHV